MKDKFGYTIPSKEVIPIEHGSGKPKEEFETKITELVNIVNKTYPEEHVIQNRFNLLLSATSKLMQQIMIEAVERHEKGQNPNYGLILTISKRTRDRMEELSTIFNIQELSVASYLQECPELMREENEYIVKKTKEMGLDGVAAKMKEVFDSNWNKEFHDDTQDRKK